jgi:ABC-2 type transport system ATP-binding protein
VTGPLPASAIDPLSSPLKDAGGPESALSVRELSYEYPPAGKGRAGRLALDGISFSIPRGAFYCILGPNGSGKSTLFRILSTASIPRPGVVSVFGCDIASGRLGDIRSWIGVVFQNPALDKKLTVRENLACHGKLYGLSRAVIAGRSADLLGRLSLSDRAADPVDTLSGGLQRRVELAKALLHAPRILLMDEPTTGLDPTARIEFLSLLRSYQRDAGTTIVYTTHILEEADECDGLLILDRGSIVARGTPEQLRSEVGRELIIMKSRDPEKLMTSLTSRYRLPIYRVDDVIRVECDNASSLLPELLRTYEGSVDMVQLSRPSIEDVYIKKTGHTFRSANGGMI